MAEPRSASATDSQARELLRRLGPAGPLALVAAIMPALGGFLLLGTLNIVGPWLRSHDQLGVALYTSAFALLAGFALLPTYAQSILGGWAFGFGVGFPAALGGFFGGALLGYLVGRRAAGDRVVRIIEEHPKWKAVYTALLGSGFWKTLLIVTLLRAPPNSPFAMTNLVMAATRVPIVPYLLGTIIGMAPRTGLAVYLAAGLRELDFDFANPPWVWIVGVAVTLLAIAIIGYIANQALAKVAGVAPDPASSEPR